ncbi:MAG: DNA methylase [Lachnospiraceae bacterium]|nr:DNA methylase [Lachnospiraceae bacterium]
MTDSSSIYISIDLKSFYASVECVERNLDPMTTKLVVADESRTDNTICLAVSPELKKYGLSGRSRLFEVRRKEAEVFRTTGERLEYIVAPPRMQLYMDYSQRIYGIYLKYISKEDIHVYSIDEVFMDVTNYLHLYKNPDGSPMTAHDLARTMIRDVLRTTGITATAGIGTNLYLCKIAMDIMAKHVEADEDGVRIAYLDEALYKEQLWDFRPLRSFWRIGSGISKKLEKYGMYTMGDIARMSLLKDHNDPFSLRPDYRITANTVSGEDFLFQLFGIDAELLIDHAWGIEPTTMADIKNYKPTTNSVSSGQVLGCSYPKEKGCLILREMMDAMALDLVSKKLVTNQIALDVGYDKNIPAGYKGKVRRDHYGRLTPKPAHGSTRLGEYSSSSRLLTEAAVKLYQEITDDNLLVHRLTVTFAGILEEEEAEKRDFQQIDLFQYLEMKQDPVKEQEKKEAAQKERRLQEAMLSIKGKYGKNAVLRGMNLEEGATMKERNEQIGGHKA